MKGHRAWGNAAGSGQLAASMLEVGGALRGHGAWGNAAGSGQLGAGRGF